MSTTRPQGPLRIPEGLAFPSLGLKRDLATGRLLFVPAVLASVCLFNGLDPGLVLTSELRSNWLISAWYFLHLQTGGDRHPVAEGVVVEIAAQQTQARDRGSASGRPDPERL
ncbi:MAG: hypothetical protein ABI831_24405 [Betaproteobacteria bacterium]